MNRILVFSITLSSLLGSFAAATDWPRFRGSGQTGSSSETSVVPAGDMALKVAWRRDLGSGYSSISIADGRAVTMFSEGGEDVLAAFGSDAGEEIWRVPMGPRYEGHTGSDAGPASTPTIDNGRVFALGRTGRLLAVELHSGSEIWSRQLVLGREASEPHYGFATTPLVADDVVVVQTGGPEGHSISAFDKDSGVQRWAIGDDVVSYQSPALIELGGIQQVVALGENLLVGIDPSSGDILWQHRHGTTPVEAFTMPTPLGEDRIMINSMRDTIAFRVAKNGDDWVAEELWRSNAFGRSYAIPVVHEGFLYGFKDRFLACIDATTGETMWKSRPPGGKGLIVVDGHLMIVAPDGAVVVAEASPEGYVEKTRLPALERGSQTPASFADGLLFIRDLREMIALRLTAGEVAVAAQDSGRQLMGEFGELVRRAEASEDRQELLDSYLAAHPVWPIVEGDDLVHFLWRGEADDVALAGTFLKFEEQLPMHRIGGTDLHFRSLRLAADSVWEYWFIVDMGRASADPQNPLAVDGFFGAASELRMSGWKIPDFVSSLTEPGDTDAPPAGRLDSFEFRSDIRGDTRRIQLYLPASYESSDERFPIVVIHYGAWALQSASLDKILDRLQDDRTQPFVAVLLPSGSLEEQGGEASADYIRFLADELIPHLDRHYRTITEPSGRAIMGIIDSGTISMYAVFARPDVFGAAASQSLYLQLKVTSDLMALIEQHRGDPPRLIVNWNEHDVEIDDGGIDCAADSQRFQEVLQQRGFAVDGGEQLGSWGWSTWRAQYGGIFAALFPRIAD